MLDTHAVHLSGFDLPENLHQLWYQRYEKLQFVPPGHQNDYGYLKARNILLIPEPLVGREEHLEFAGSHREEGAILEGSPTHFGNGTNLMTLKVSAKTARDALIK